VADALHHPVGPVVNGPLDGIRVVDATAARAGPACARQLADLGADVIQVGRDRPSFGASDYWNLHRNKRSIALNLKDPDDHQLLLDLVDGADVFLENDGRQIEVLRHPVNFSETPATVRSGPAIPGEHTAAVKAEIASRRRA
jgi:crotonobetainyl-CoA:carnitine CoA-transferase CaiB-like acyl-CoA transferase